jgi:branched-chain amino acid transport system substrate-binding protein
VRRIRLAVLLLCAAPAVTHADVRIGVAGPMTTSDAAFGAQMRTGVEQAVADINASGGVLGQTLSVTIGDDAADPKRGRILANKFVADGIRFVIGDFNSSVTLASSDIYAAGGTLLITPGSTNPQVTERGLTTMFRTCGRDDGQTRVAADYLATQTGRRIAILHDRTSYGQGLADSVRANLAARGVQEAFFDGIAKGSRDFSATLARMEQAGADIVFWGGGAADAGLLARQMHERGRGAMLLGTDSLAGEDFASVAGLAGEGTLMTFPQDPRTRPAAADLVKRLAARNVAADPYVIYAYAAVQAIKGAAEAAHSLDPAAVAAALHAGSSFHTVLGDIAFDGKGDLTRPDAILYAWHKGPDGRLAFAPLAR